MANKFGLRPVRRLDGSPLNFQTKKVFHAAADGVAVYLGQLVKYATMVTTGNPLNRPTVAAYAAGDTSTAGVVVGVDPVEGITDTTSAINLNRKHCPASTAMYLNIIDDPAVVFEISSDNGGAALAGADILENADVVVGTGNAYTGLSATQLDSSTHNTTNTLPLRIVGFSEKVGNDLGLDGTIAEVILNQTAGAPSNPTGLAL